MSKEQAAETLIIGGGIAGLSAAYNLFKKKIPFRLMESNSFCGGLIQSVNQSGYQLELGPNSLVLSPALEKLINELNLNKEVISAAAISKNRYLLRKGKLHAVSPHPFKIISSKYISAKAKWRLFTERFREKMPVDKCETVSSFVKRRFGQELLDYAFNPILSGIYAGDPERLLIREVLPQLLQWEQEYGSITKGLMQKKGAGSGRKIISFQNGLATLPKALSLLMEYHIDYNFKVLSIKKKESAYQVHYEKNGEAATADYQQIICTAPAYVTAGIVEKLDNKLADKLSQIEYPEIWELQLAYDRDQIADALEGFGFLVPHKEKEPFLGVIYSSAVFPQKVPEGKILLTVLCGGASQENFLRSKDEKEIISQIIHRLAEILKISSPPMMQYLHKWEKGIPQFNENYIDFRKSLVAFEQQYSNIHLKGNYVDGVAVTGLIEKMTSNK